jgi:glutamate carboxypeptidase
MPSELAAKLLAWLPSQLPEAFTWLERMVAINSFSANPHGVNKVGALTAECFVDLGFQAEAVPSTDRTYGSHLFLRRNGSEGPPVVLVTHLDTVFPAAEEERNHFHWHPVPEENRIYGPGTVDIKGGTILIWLMLRALQKFAPEVFERTHWLIAANASEEVLSGDFAMRTAERCPIGARAVLVFEGGPHEGDEWHLVTSRKGRAEYRISAQGRAAHAGSAHQQGVNAVVGLCEAVQRAAALSDLATNLTVNVAQISGGTVLNRVPHEAEAALEMRAFDADVLQRAGDAVFSLAGRTANGTSINAECLGKTPAWSSDAGTQSLCAHWAAAAHDLSLKVKPVPRSGLSDANYLSHLGPTRADVGRTRSHGCERPLLRTKCRWLKGARVCRERFVRAESRAQRAGPVADAEMRRSPWTTAACCRFIRQAACCRG